MRNIEQPRPEIDFAAVEAEAETHYAAAVEAADRAYEHAIAEAGRYRDEATIEAGAVLDARLMELDNQFHNDLKRIVHEFTRARVDAQDSHPGAGDGPTAKRRRLLEKIRGDRKSVV